MTDVKQFKLTNNDEIVCEVASWNDERRERKSLMVRVSFD